MRSLFRVCCTVLFALAFAAILSACSKPKPPEITPKRAKVTAVTPAGIELLAEMEATNPNGVDLVIESVTAKMTIDTTFDVGTVTVPKTVTLPSKKATPMDVPMTVKWTDMAAMAKLAASNRDVPYDVEGKVTLGGVLLGITVPFHMKGTMTHAELVKATMQSIPTIPGLPPLPFPQ
jgi:LEA14-like dessication related protein